MTARGCPTGPRLLDRLSDATDQALTLLFEDPSIGRLIVSPDGLIMRANTEMARLVGPAADLSPGAPMLHLFAPEAGAAVWGELRPLLDGAAASRCFSVRLAAGSTAPALSVTALPVREADGGISGALLCLREIAEQTCLDTPQTPRGAARSQEEAVAGLVHDFNNLLAGIVGASDAIAAQEGLSGEVHEELAQIRAITARGSALVRRLLAVGREQVAQPQVLAVNEVMTDIAEVLRRVVGGQVRIELTLAQPGPQIRADPTALDRVLVNLASNARDAMPGGGVLTLRSGVVMLDHPLPARPGRPDPVPPGRYALIEVDDTGTGIAAEHLPRLFASRFTTHRARGGHGLGLATVYRLIRQAGGFITVESAPGQGTCVRAYLPCWTGAAALRPACGTVATAAAATPSAAGTVLLVEDEPLVRRMTERALRRRGWRVLGVDSAEAALAAVADGRASAPAAVVTDLLMPGQDGAALVRTLRARLGAPTLPAILITGDAAATERKDVIAALGGNDAVLLSKPFDIAVLDRRLAELLGSGRDS